MKIVNIIVLLFFYMSTYVHANERFCKKYNSLISDNLTASTFVSSSNYLEKLYSSEEKGVVETYKKYKNLIDFLKKNNNSDIYIYVRDDLSVISNSFTRITMQNKTVKEALSIAKLIYVNSTDIDQEVIKILDKLEAFPPTLLKLNFVSEEEYQIKELLFNKCIDPYLFLKFISNN